MDRKLETGHILQIGPTNWQEEVTIPEGLNWHYFSIQTPLQIEDYMAKQGIKEFQALVLDHPERLLSFKEELGLFQPYTVFYDQVYDQESVTEELEHLMQLVQAKAWDFPIRLPFSINSIASFMTASMGMLLVSESYELELTLQAVKRSEGNTFWS